MISVFLMADVTSFLAVCIAYTVMSHSVFWRPLALICFSSKCWYVTHLLSTDIGFYR